MMQRGVADRARLVVAALALAQLAEPQAADLSGSTAEQDEPTSASRVEEQGPHRGWVTGLCAVGRHVLACSQAGVYAHGVRARSGLAAGAASRDAASDTASRVHARLLWKPTWRAVDVDSARGFVVVGGGKPAEEGMVAVFSLRVEASRERGRGDKPRKPNKRGAAARAMHAATTAQKLAAAKLSDLTRGETAERKVAHDLVDAVAIHPLGGEIAMACRDGRVMRASLARTVGGRLGIVKPRLVFRHSASARAVAYSPDGKWLASGGLDRVVVLAELAKLDKGAAHEDCVHVHDDHSGGVECLAWRADSGVVASGARDGRLRLHRAGARLIQSARVAFDPELPPPAIHGVVWLAKTKSWHFALADGRRFELAGSQHPKVRGRAAAGVRSLLVNRDLWIGGFARVQAVEVER